MNCVVLYCAVSSCPVTSCLFGSSILFSVPCRKAFSLFFVICELQNNCFISVCWADCVGGHERMRRKNGRFHIAISSSTPLLTELSYKATRVCRWISLADYYRTAANVPAVGEIFTWNLPYIDYTLYVHHLNAYGPVCRVAALYVMNRSGNQKQWLH
jgi:hypothetical protein